MLPSRLNYHGRELLFSRGLRDIGSIPEKLVDKRPHILLGTCNLGRGSGRVENVLEVLLLDASHQVPSAVVGRPGTSWDPAPELWRMLGCYGIYRSQIYPRL